MEFTHELSDGRIMKLVKFSRLAKCVNCGSAADVMTHTSILSNIMGACRKCVSEHGWDTLIGEANRQLSHQSALKVNVDALRAVSMEGKCLHCGEATIKDLNGSFPMLCTECQRELKGLGV